MLMFFCADPWLELRSLYTESEKFAILFDFFFTVSYAFFFFFKLLVLCSYDSAALIFSPRGRRENVKSTENIWHISKIPKKNHMFQLILFNSW